MKKSVLITFFAFCFSIFLGLAQEQKKPVEAKIGAEELEFDFGTIKEADGPVSHVFVISNWGKAPLVITRVNASCGCTTPTFSTEPIPPKGKSEIIVTFNPMGRPGRFVKTIAIYSNGKDGAFTLRIKGHVE